MLAQGYTKIGWIGDFEHCQSFFERYRAFRCAMALADVPVDEAHIIRQSSTKVLKKALASAKTLPDVFICANDFAAQDAINVLTELGKRVPDDVRICGFDDSPDSRHSTPPITTVHIHIQVMALSAAHLIVSRMKEPSLDFRSIYTEADLILRESTGHLQGGTQ
jgi:LacI family transcriptional regulator